MYMYNTFNDKSSNKNASHLKDKVVITQNFTESGFVYLFSLRLLYEVIGDDP